MAPKWHRPHVLPEKATETTTPKETTIVVPLCRKCFFSSYLFELLLGAKLTGVSTLLLSAILSTGGKTGVALAADCLLTVESLREKSESWVVNTSTKTENKVESRFLLDVVVA